MRTQNIYFSKQKPICVFPKERSDLVKASTELRLEGSYSVIVLIGGAIDVKEADVTRCAIETIAGIAERKHLVIICGGTDMGVMAEIGQVRQQNHYKFPLIGIAPEELVSFPGGPRSTKFLWWGKQRWRLEPHYSHFILVPGSKFGDESPWIVDTATLLSKGHKAVTILINGGEVSRKDIELSLEINRHVIVLSRTGRLADELTREPDRDKLITVVPANSEQRIVEAIQEELSTSEGNVLSKLLVNAM